MNSKELADTLAAFAPFQELGRAELETLAASMEVVRAEDGERLVKEGAPADGCWVLLDGRVRIDHEHEGETVALRDLEAGELFGLLGLLDHRPHSASCRAVGDVTCARLRAEPFNLLHEARPELALHLQRLVARQLARDARMLNAALVETMLEQDRAGDDATRLSGTFHLSAG